MRKFLLMVLAAAVLGSGAAFAQDDMMDNGGQWFGVSTGFPVGLVLHYGMADLIRPGIDLRANVSAFTFFGDYFYINAGADALYHLNLETENDLPLDVYVGGGANVGLGLSSLGSSFGVGIQALGGAEYMITDQFGAFGELRVGVGIAPIFRPSLAIGVNYHF